MCESFHPKPDPLPLTIVILPLTKHHWILEPIPKPQTLPSLRPLCLLRRIRHSARPTAQQPGNVPLALSRQSGRVDARRRRQSRQHQNQREDDGEEDDDLALDGTLGPVLGPLAAALGNVALDRVAAELEPDHAGERDAVAEELQARDGRAPDGDRGEDEDDVFEHAAERQDEGGGFANLELEGRIGFH